MGASMIEAAQFEFPADLRQSWKEGSLRDAWAAEYPQLFDADDVRQSLTQGPRGYHFIEWLAAIILYSLTGYHALVTKYEFANHPRKKRIFEQLLDPSHVEFIRGRTARRVTQCPDLLMYEPGLSSWFFCEVKGPGDRIRPSQVAFFNELATLTGRPVNLIRLRQVKVTDAKACA
jgi:hypothetical protein